jgi:branched-chain amino acid transport system permease protein
MKTMTRLRVFLKKNAFQIAFVVALLAIANLVPMRSSTVMMFTVATIYAIAAMGFNILLGVSGQASLGHAALIGIGAYTSANLAGLGPLPYPLILLASGLMAVVVGVLLGFPAIRLGGYYLAIATLGFGEVIQQVFVEWPLFTRGNRGLAVPTPHLVPPDWLQGLPANIAFFFNMRDRVNFLSMTIVVAVVMYVLGQSILGGKVGRALKAMRDSSHAAQAMGINLSYYKLVAFAISAFYAGVAGSLLAHHTRYLMPSNFGILMSLSLIAMVAIGGLGLLAGAIWGAAFYEILPMLISRIPLAALQTIPASILTGTFLILVVMFMPYGLAGIPYRLLGLWHKTGVPERLSRWRKPGRGLDA